MIGYDLIGEGRCGVIVLHDWLCDTSTWQSVRLYLNEQDFTWVFADLRGYGKSKEQTGEYSIEEAASDVISLANALNWKRFVIVGHSMSTLVALHIAQIAPERIDRVVLVCPVPRHGLGVDDSVVAALVAIAKGDDAHRMQAVKYTVGDRLSEGWGWIRYKANRWRATSIPDAVAGYVPMFAKHGLLNPTTPVSVPVLAVTGEQDDPSMRSAAIRESLSPLCPKLSIETISACGHYPMQEAPPLFATIVERFLNSCAG